MLNTKFDLYKTEWLDLVFADRNKSYGAYDLRIHYGDNMMKALAIIVLGITVAAISLTIAFKHDVVPDVLIQTQVIPLVAPKVIPEIEKPKEAVLRTPPKKVDAAKPSTTPQINIKTQEFTTPEITTRPVDNDIKIDPNITISNTTNTGDATKPVTGILDGTVKPGTGGTPGVDNGTGVPDDRAYDPNGIDVMPEPIGGAAAWSKFLQKNLRYPDTDQEGRVTISFIVEKDGHLTDIKILKGVVSELDREALRVLKLAPAWKPGMQNGHAVRVKYTIPIVFQMAQ